MGNSKVHYKGKLVHHEDIKFRFWGHGDDVLVVRVGGDVVLNASWPDDNRGTYQIGGSWQSSAANSRTYFLGNLESVVGDWITLKAGEPLDMEVIIGEVPGGAFCSYLLVEVDGVEYEKNRQGAPILPMFKTEEPSLDLVDAISQHLILEEASITNGPVFRDYVTSERKKTVADDKEGWMQESHTAAAHNSTVRLWTKNNGKTVEAEYLSLVAGRVILKTSQGKRVKIQLDDLSPADTKYIELIEAPDLKLSFTKSSSQRTMEVTPYLPEDPPKILDYEFGAKVRQKSAFEYGHELTVEFFAVGQRLLNSNEYCLLDRQTSTFIPSPENQRSHQFSGEKIETMEYELDGIRRGIRYAGNVVIVTDERGEIIAHSSSAKWLMENLENLKKIPVGRFMDKTCNRIIPTGPKPTLW